jgi:hypothetical protein
VRPGVGAIQKNDIVPQNRSIYFVVLAGGYKTMKLKAWCLALSLLVCLPLVGQKITSTIRGTVTDQTGAVLSGAQVTVINTGTADTRTAVTSAEGVFAVTELQPGVYEVRAKHANFKESVTKSNELHVSSDLVVNITLQVGSQGEQVTVEANAIQVETTGGVSATTVEGNQVRELPLNGRSFVQLTQLMPGVSAASNFDSKNKGLMSGVDFSVNGNSTTGNLFLVDGVNNNDIGSNRTILIYPSIDSIQEFKLLRNSYGPEYGQAMGAIVNIVTRGGTNQFHGSAYYFGRNDKLNATDFFNTLNGQPKSILRRNDFGYSIGGPVVKDKFFLFWSQEWNREIRAKTRAANVPTAAEMAGDFSTLRRDSTGTLCENSPLDPVATAAAGHNVTFASEGVTTVAQASAMYPGTGTDPTGALLVQLLPAGNISAGNVVAGSCNNWSTNLSSPIKWREENLRGDYKLGRTWSIMARYTQDTWGQPFPELPGAGFWGDDPFPAIESSWSQPAKQATLKVTKLLGTTAVNDFQFSYGGNRIAVAQSGLNPGLGPKINATYAPFFGYSIKENGTKLAHPLFWGGFGNGGGDNNLWTQGPWKNNESLIILKDDFSKVSGAHTFKAGFIGTQNQKNELATNASDEGVDYWGVAGGKFNGVNNLGDTTNNGIFNALWGGRIWGFGERQFNPYAQDRWKDIEMYFGDTWKARRNLSIEYGVRWSLLRMPYSGTDSVGSFQISLYNPAGSGPCNGLLVPKGGAAKCAALFPGTTAPTETDRSLKANNNHTIAPRFGIAWDPKGDGKMSLRAGVGQFYQRERLTFETQLAGNPPFALAAGGSRQFSVAPAPGSLTASGAPSYGQSPSNVLPNTWQWNLTAERELYRDTKLELAYVGNRGTHLARFIDGNPVAPANRLAYALNNVNTFRPDVNAGNIPYVNWTAGSNYHALQALFRSQMKGLDAQFAYTFSKSLADTDINNSGSGSSIATSSDQFNPHRDYGPTTINRPHVFTGNIVYTIPTFAGMNAFARSAVGGWELTSILSYASGPSLTVFAGNSPTGAPGGFAGNATGQGNVKPNLVPGQSCRASSSLKTQWLNPAKWTVDNYVLGTFGNSPTGVCAGPGLANTDFSVYKNFKVTERLAVQFRLEMYNAFNKVQFRADSLQGGNTANPNFAGTSLACTAANNGPGTGPCAGHAVNTVGFNPSGGLQGQFGQLTNDRGPREIQYALKFIF